MTETIQVGEIPIIVTLKDVQNVHLSVHPPDGHVTLVAPTSTRLDVARAYAISKLGWIREQQHNLTNQARETPRSSLNERATTFGGGAICWPLSSGMLSLALLSTTSASP
jgi:predicted metal-dependent hydrolase